MATPAVDIATLTDQQRSSLEQYTAVTAQEVEAAILILQRSEWNTQIAIARFFDGEPATDPVAEALAQRPEDIRRQETLMNGFSSSSSSSRRSLNLEPAPRIVPQSDGQIAYRANPILGILFMPVSLVYSILSRVFRLFGYLFPFLPRLINRIGGTPQGSSPQRNAGGRIGLKPKDAALRFIRDFEEEYGAHELPFFENGYAQALDAAKRDLKFLLVILLSPEHDDTTSFVRETLLDPSVVNFVKNPENNVLLWAGTVQDAEAYQVSAALSCAKFPFSAIICHTPSVSSTAMSIITRLVGPMQASTYLSKIQRAMEQYSAGLARTRNARVEQNAVRNLREEQNSAYERSLAQDRERSRKKKEEEQKRQEEEAATKKAEEEKQNYEHNLDQWRRWRAQRIDPEPSADVKDVVRISLRLLDGERVIRKFGADATIEELYAFVECYDIVQAGGLSEKTEKPGNFVPEYKFRLVSPMPREAFELAAGGTIKERIGRSGNLIVERTVLDDSEDEEQE